MSHKQTILVVQADREVARMIRKTLEGDGYRVLTARNGLEGLNLVDRERPDLVITELMLPRIDGATLLKALRSRESTRDIPVIFLSTNADAITMLESLSLGARNFLTTPILDSALRHHVGRVIP